MHRARPFAVLAVSVAGICTGAAAHGAILPVVNPSFETPDAVGGTPNFTVTGWGKGADVGIINDGPNNGPGTPPAASDGTQIAFLGNGTNATNIFQDIANAGQPGATSYTLTVAFAIRAGFGETPGTNGTINLGIVDLTGTGVLLTTPILRSALTNTFQDFSVVLPGTTVAPGDAIRIFVDKLAGNSLIVIDNVRLVSVPEPTLATVGLALACGLAGRSRRR